MIDCCYNVYLYSIFCTFKIGPDEEETETQNDYKEYLNPMYMTR